MIYEILDDKGKVINRIVADLDFVEKHYPGHYRDVTPPPAPEPKRFILTRYEFRSLFSFQELVTITTAAKTDAVIQVFMDGVQAAEEVDLRYGDVAQGLGYLVGQNFITQEKMNNILAGV